MNYTHVLIRYGELGTKGKNKRDFINTLNKNVKVSIKDINGIEVIKRHDRIFLVLNGADINLVKERLSSVSGIANFSFARRVNNNPDEIINECLNQSLEKSVGTFKVVVKRADKSFPIPSDELTRMIASKILKNTEHKVDVHKPSFYVKVEIRLDGSFVFSDVIKGAGGFPLGTMGKTLVLTSGGIDSPAAMYLMMKRGIKIEAIHFASPPYTSKEALVKVTDLLNVFSDIQETIKLHVIPFTALQEAIYRYADESYAITLMRRMMYRISEIIAIKNNCLALGSGESIGQVASQTLESLQVINEVIKMPVIRPLATMDKNEIINISKQLGTYEISIRPFIDCCTIFTPVNPVTRPKSNKAEYYESKFDYMSLINECIENEEIIYIKKNAIDEDIEEFL